MAAAWLKTYTSAGDFNGRVNLDNILYCQAYGSGSTWRAGAWFNGGSAVANVQISPTLFASQADAAVAIDDLLLNGS